MSELRHDPVSRRWVIIAEERSERPLPPIQPGSSGTSRETCPFCPGREESTPPEIQRFPAGEEAWKVRVVPNKYPALAPDVDVVRQGLGVYDRISGLGTHEVVVETPDHDAGLVDLEPAHMALVLKAYRERLRRLLEDRRLKYVLVFKNHGAAAGASLAHSHAQIIATTVTPHTIAGELLSCFEHHQVKERCLFCDLLRQELDEGRRVVLEDEAFVTWTPYASRFPYEMWLLPRQHGHSFAELSDRDLDALAVHLQGILRRLGRTLDDPPFNFVLHTAPNPNVVPRRAHHFETLAFDYHWHLEILPRVTRIAGFEWGTGFYINPVPPEAAARALR